MIDRLIDTTKETMDAMQKYSVEEIDSGKAAESVGYHLFMLLYNLPEQSQHVSEPEAELMRALRGEGYPLNICAFRSNLLIRWNSLLFLTYNHLGRMCIQDQYNNKFETSVKRVNRF